jgi:hypothetical protein
MAPSIQKIEPVNTENSKGCRLLSDYGQMLSQSFDLVSPSDKLK